MVAAGLYHWHVSLSKDVKSYYKCKLQARWNCQWLQNHAILYNIYTSLIDLKLLPWVLSHQGLLITINLKSTKTNCNFAILRSHPVT